MSYLNYVAIVFITCLTFCFAQGSGSAKIEDSLKNITKLLYKIYKKLDPDYQNAIIRDVAWGNRKNTKQSSTFDNKPPDQAVDGNLNTFSHTAIQYKPYWIIDLGKSYKIKRIEIYNRRDCCGSRLHDVDIFVGKSHNEMVLCNHYKGPGRNGEHLIFSCLRQLSGRYVKIRIYGKEYLHLAEVKVYALVKSRT